MLSSHMTFCAKSNDVEFDTCSLLEVFRTVKWPRFSWTLKVRVVSSISDELPQTVCSPARAKNPPHRASFQVHIRYATTTVKKKLSLHVPESTSERGAVGELKE